MSINVITLTASDLETMLAQAAERGATLALKQAQAIPAPQTGPEYLTVSEVAATLRITPRTVHQWAADGKLTKLRSEDGLPRFKRAEVERVFGSKQRGK
jgi:excisionase family DNA binding protein